MRTEDNSREGTGLAPFSDPVYLDDREADPSDARRPTAEAGSLPGLLFRTALGGALVAAAPLLVGGGNSGDTTTGGGALGPADLGIDRWSVTTVAVAAVAVALAVGVLVDRRRARLVRTWPAFVAVAVDLVALGVIGIRVERLQTVALVAVALVGLHRWMYGRAVGVASATALGSLVLAATFHDAVEADWFTVLCFAVVAAALVWIVDDQDQHGTRTRRGLRLATGRSDAILQGLNESVVLTDADGLVRNLNPAAEELTGHSTASSRLLPCELVLGLADEDGPVSCAGGCALTCSDGPRDDLWRVGPRGERQPMFADAVELHDADGQVVEIVHTLRDISAMKQAEEAKSLFLATTSHELKTPLTVIRGFSQLLAETDVDEQTLRQAADAIQTRSIELAAIVDRILMSSRIEAGHVDVHAETQPLVPTVAGRVEDYRASTGRRIDLVVDADAPDAWMDTTALATIVDHLIDNALKYSEEASPITVEINAGHDGDADRPVGLSIRDRGFGMTADQRDHCFDRFWQGEGTGARRFGGTGIGLYIVRSLVQAMHATITVDSAPGEGTCFDLRFRTAPPSTSAPAAVSAGAGEPTMVREFMRQVGVLSHGATR